MSGRSGLGEFEQLVLLVVVRLRAEAFGPEVAEELERSVGRAVTRGALYSTLNRLEEKGLLAWRAEEPGPERSRHIRRLFAVTEAGLIALQERRETLLTLWDGIEQVLEDGVQGSAWAPSEGAPYRSTPMASNPANARWDDLTSGEPRGRSGTSRQQPECSPRLGREGHHSSSNDFRGRVG
ncbi:MAG TPA: PadR family transcriptional regulator [Gemmatimonadetes bacterium]|nr:PadR family transcriptional regulator [Gemmatimonadota bacterium]